MNEVIEIKNLSKTFKIKVKEKGFKGSIKNIFKPKYKEIKAVNTLSLNIEKGEIIAFIGPNGADPNGKTSFDIDFMEHIDSFITNKTISKDTGEKIKKILIIS